MQSVDWGLEKANMVVVPNERLAIMLRLNIIEGELVQDDKLIDFNWHRLRGDRWVCWWPFVLLLDSAEHVVAEEEGYAAETLHDVSSSYIYLTVRLCMVRVRLTVLLVDPSNRRSARRIWHGGFAISAR